MKTKLTTVCAGFVACLCFILISCDSVNAETITSIQTGDFNDPDTWDGGEVPGPSDSVVILGEHTVTVTANCSVQSVCVYNNIDGEQAILTINTTMQMTIADNLTVHADGAAEYEEPIARVNLRGILVVGKHIYLRTIEEVENTTIASIRMTTAGSSNRLELGGTIVNEGGGGFIDAHATNQSTVKLTGSSSVTLNMTGDIEFHHLTIEKTGGATVTLGGESLNTNNILGNFTLETGNFNNGGFTLAGVSGKTLTVKTGTTLVLNGTSMPTGFTITLQASSTIEYRGTATVTARTYQNLSIAGAGTKTLGGATTVSGNMALSGGTFDVADVNNYALSVAGNWINSGGTFQPRNGTVTFNGGSDQAITSNGNGFYNVTINNTAAQVSLNDNMTVTNLLTLTDGVITTGGSYVILTSTTTANLAGFSGASFVNGNLRRYIATNTDTYAFPVGNGTGSSNYYRADLVNGNLAGISYINAVFEALTNHDDEDMDVEDSWGSGSLTYTTLNNEGVWDITPNAAPSGGTYDVRLYTVNMSGLTDNQFAPLKRPSNSVTAADWSTGGGTLNNGSGDGRLVVHGYAVRRGLSSFSEFGVGRGTASGGGLPIKLLSFEAVEDEGRVNLKWITATEVNNDFFTIERSQSGEEFEIMNTFQGSGNSSVTLKYLAVDHHPYAGLSYYRLKQTDYDGTFTYSDVVAVEVGAVEASITVLTNPVLNKTVTLKAKGMETQGVSKPFVMLTDRNGKTVFTQTNLKLAGDGVSSIELPRELTPGIYFFSLFNGKTTFRSKLFVE